MPAAASFSRRLRTAATGSMVSVTSVARSSEPGGSMISGTRQWYPRPMLNPEGDGPQVLMASYAAASSSKP